MHTHTLGRYTWSTYMYRLGLLRLLVLAGKSISSPNMAAFTHRQTTPKKVPRGSVVRKFESSDDDDDSSDLSDSEDEQSWKRRKTAPVAPSTSHGMPPGGPSVQGAPRDINARSQGASSMPSACGAGGPGNRRGPGGGPRRRNNVWGSVVAEQNQEMVEREMTQFGVETGAMERDVESYYRPSQQPQLGLMAAEPPPQLSAPQGRREIMKGVGEGDDDAWLAEHSPPRADISDDDEGEDHLGRTAHPDLRDRLMQRGSMVADQFRRSSVRSRLGVRPHDERSEPETIMKPMEIDPEGEPKVVAGQLAYSLQEPKRDLMLRIVKTLGVKKSVEIWRKTEEIELDGGMMIRDRSRRRSPGGVFIQLMKTDPDVTKEDIKLIFAEEKAAFEEEKKKRRRHARRHKKRGSMDVDRHNDEGTEELMEDAGSGGGNGQGNLGDTAPQGGEEVAPVEPLDRRKDPDFFGLEEIARRSGDVDDLPPPKQECADLKEHDVVLDFMTDFKADDIPKRNEDSEPEDGEVIDEEEEEEDIDNENVNNNNIGDH